MLISLNEIKKLVNIPVSDEALFELIDSRLVEIESVSDWSKKYKNIYIVKVVSCEPIEGTHLHLCEIDAGSELNKKFDPDHSLIQVVCGAPNVKQGMFAVWIAPGAVVPQTFETLEPFEISERKLRGFMSYGMLAGADELGLGDDHSGIVELNPKENYAPGSLFADAFDLNDKIIEVENKSLTHRPDCFGLFGFAREVAGVLGQPFELSLPAETPLSSVSSDISLKISDPSLCPRYSAFVFELKPETPSPYLSANDIFLYKASMRPVSPIVDLTNLVMLKTGQPSHAFDLDKFLSASNSKSLEIGVRSARKGEKLLLLDGKEVSLTPSDIVITSADTPVALAGAMGGKSTEIDASTSRVVLEVASFSLYNLRKTQMSHGLFSEAITRFTKGRPATDFASTVSLLKSGFSSELNANLLSESEFITPTLLDLNKNFIQNVVKITRTGINSLLGTQYSDDLIEKTLKNVGFSIKKSEEKTAKTLSETPEKSTLFEISIPLWRTDIKIKEDIIEEIGRLLGYDNIPLSFPNRPFTCASIDPMLSLKSSLRTILSDRLEANELLTYSFVSKKLQEKAGENPEDSYIITNSISPELECFRQSLVPSLLEKSFENEKSGHKNFTLYELNQVAKKSFGLSPENVPNLETHLGLVSPGDFYALKHLLLELEKSLRLKFIFKPLDLNSVSNAPFLEPLRSASISIQNSDREVSLGVFGELKSSVKSSFKLSQISSGLELNLSPLLGESSHKKLNLKLSKYPFVSRDLTVRVREIIRYEEIESLIRETLESEPDLLFKLTPVSIFQIPLAPTKNLSFHLEISNLKKTLTSSEISDIMKKITKKLEKSDAEIV